MHTAVARLPGIS